MDAGSPNWPPQDSQRTAKEGRRTIQASMEGPGGPSRRPVVWCLMASRTIALPSAQRACITRCARQWRTRVHARVRGGLLLLGGSLADLEDVSGFFLVGCRARCGVGFGGDRAERWDSSSAPARSKACSPRLLRARRLSLIRDLHQGRGTVSAFAVYGPFGRTAAAIGLILGGC